ncbi:MAG: GNAT family N-acetyltransferase [Lewinellaceae bacterium]|nr:GNAT family N-acetyltransferase [Phaeodactylibacter sp.]MCB9350456.1 GNAT family N-acetyltransferase [Lewinellaceae bacterium]
MKLQSKRLTFTRFTSAELPLYLQLVTNARVMEHISGRALTEEEGSKRFEKALSFNLKDEETGNFMAHAREDGQYLGLAKLTVTNEGEAEIGYALLPEFWGQQYATEIVGYFVGYARQLKRFRRLFAIVDPGNPPSIRVLEKFGFKPYKEGEIDGLPAVYYELYLPAG